MPLLHKKRSLPIPWNVGAALQRMLSLSALGGDHPSFFLVIQCVESLQIFIFGSLCGQLQLTSWLIHCTQQGCLMCVSISKHYLVLVNVKTDVFLNHLNYNNQKLKGQFTQITLFVNSCLALKVDKQYSRQQYTLTTSYGITLLSDLVGSYCKVIQWCRFKHAHRNAL